MIRVDIESIMMANGPMPSLVVLRERDTAAHGESKPRALSIQTGAFEAAAIGQGIDDDTPARPITHDLLLSTVRSLGAHVERVEISRMDAPVFYATVVLDGNRAVSDETPAPARGEIKIDARPSDALALAVRSNAPIYVEDDVMNRAGTTQPAGTAGADDTADLDQLDELIKHLTPDDF